MSRHLAPQTAPRVDWLLDTPEWVKPPCPNGCASLVTTWGEPNGGIEWWQCWKCGEVFPSTEQGWTKRQKLQARGQEINGIGDGGYL